MPDESQTQMEGEEAMVGLKADVKTLKQLSSSAKAVREKRENNKDEMAIRLFHEAVFEGVTQGEQSSNQTTGN
ncbi:hypothetical protein BO78DRAFT_398739 [Aspergillus sclerotiicarbonarius CBS 121057]|uniref:Uncharacterized protein n=1 Tax=Aspergillus sclerotiicarbonarius (strain CBS 121057 / IBT 28362) TaxID=1448318 RepID=A0A319EM40_ASPSB|nr:hypothetical protein BO78DRAFT_398739 [Aspergillus sclerotiicarbonarius CBS 121057]